jgi:hypothetical protein
MIAGCSIWLSTPPRLSVSVKSLNHDAGLTDLEAARPWFKKSLADASSLKPKATRLGG